MLSICFSRSAVPFRPASEASTASSTRPPRESDEPLKTAAIAAPSCNTSFNGKATATDANMPPKTIPKLDAEPNIPKSGVIRNILPTIAPNPKMIPIRVAISIPNPLSYLLI